MDGTPTLSDSGLADSTAAGSEGVAEVGGDSERPVITVETGTTAAGSATVLSDPAFERPISSKGRPNQNHGIGPAKKRTRDFDERVSLPFRD